MAANRRLQRVEKEIYQIVSEYLITGLKVPLDGMVSVSRVSISSDFKAGKVFVTKIIDGPDMEKNVEILNEWAPYFQKEIDKKLRMKFCPKLKFINDIGYDNTMVVEKILNELKLDSDDSLGTETEGSEV